MEDKIREKLNEVRQNMPQNSSFKQWIDKSSLWSWIYSSFNLQGQKVSKACVVDLSEGRLRDEVPLASYSYVQNVKGLQRDMDEELRMQSDPSLKLFKRWSEALNCRGFRKSNPVVFEYGFIPCHFNSVEDELDGAFKKYILAKKSGMQPLLNIISLFMDVIRVFPFEEESVDMAFIVLWYCMLREGIPFPELSATEEEFHRMVASYMDNKDDADAFYNMFLRCVFNRLDAILLLEKQALEQEK